LYIYEVYVNNLLETLELRIFAHGEHARNGCVISR
jgi:hypothetical protein